MRTYFEQMQEKARQKKTKNSPSILPTKKSRPSQSRKKSQDKNSPSTSSTKKSRPSQSKKSHKP